MNKEDRIQRPGTPPSCAAMRAPGAAAVVAEGKATRRGRIEPAAVEKALRCLSTDQRQVLLLVAVEQMSYEEAAAALSVPICTVISRLSRARNRLRQLTHDSRRV